MKIVNEPQDRKCKLIYLAIVSLVLAIIIGTSGYIIVDGEAGAYADSSFTSIWYLTYPLVIIIVLSLYISSKNNKPANIFIPVLVCLLITNINTVWEYIYVFGGSDEFLRWLSYILYFGSTIVFLVLYKKAITDNSIDRTKLILTFSVVFFVFLLLSIIQENSIFRYYYSYENKYYSYSNTCTLMYSFLYHFFFYIALILIFAHESKFPHEQKTANGNNNNVFNNNTAVSKVQESNDNIELLKKLGELKENGLISEEEYNAKKSKIIDNI